MKTIRIGTRRSALAQWQANWVASQLTGVEIEFVPITTEGDLRSQPLGQMGGIGVFTKEIQQALLDNQIDLAVHSLKDLPTEPVLGLSIAAVPLRESVHDVLISSQADSIETLPESAAVGTGSIRRKAQLLTVRPDLKITDIRGNVDTRIKKLDDGLYDAIVLAEAGLKRLQLEHRITQVIPPQKMLPAIGQGALGLETRSTDRETRMIVSSIDDAETHGAVLAERALLKELRAGCLAPVAAWSRMEADNLMLDAVVLAADGERRISVRMTGTLMEAIDLGRRAALDLLARGADQLIQAVRLD